MGRDYAMWATITVKQKMRPTSERNPGPHHTGISGPHPMESPAHFDRNTHWKNRQRVKLILPLFPSYLFVHIHSSERAKVLQSPGVLQIVGNSREGVTLPDAEVEFLRSGFCKQRIAPYHEFVIGEKVRIKSGVMQGLHGTLIRKNNDMRFVLTIEMINQHAAIQVDPEDLEPIVVSS
jgi:transcription antitermination factor NusG